MLSPTFPEVPIPHLADVPIPPMLRVRLAHPKGEPVADIAAAVDEALARSRRLQDLRTGTRVAVAVGSRGIAHIPKVDLVGQGDRQPAAPVVQLDPLHGAIPCAKRCHESLHQC